MRQRVGLLLHLCLSLLCVSRGETEEERECQSRTGKGLGGKDCLDYEALPLVDPSSSCRRDDEVVPRTFFAIGPPSVPFSFRIHSASNPSFKSLYFDDTSALSFLRSRFGERVATAYSCLIPPAYRADLFRYAYLLKEGGVYADADQIFLRPIEEVVDLCSNATVGHDVPQSVQKKRVESKQMKILSGVAGNRIWECMVDRIVSNVEHWKRPTHTLLFSGPLLLQECAEKEGNVSITYRDASSGRWPEGGGMVGKGGKLLSIEKGSERDFRFVQNDVHYSVLMSRGLVVKKDCPLFLKRR